ncbi:MAG: TIR domain-containing protein [Thermoanaerobaculia bacterium]
MTSFAPRSSLPTLFVGSSSETIEVARAVQYNLHRDAVVSIWDQDVFQISRTAIESLVEQSEASDFAVFIFAPTDVVRFGEQDFVTVRDNVVFELGLFIGQIGRRRTFVVAPAAARYDRVRLPSDLAGITFGQYESDDRDLIQALGTFCTAIRKQMKELGRRTITTAKVLVERQPVESLHHFEAAFVAELGALSTIDDALQRLGQLSAFTSRLLVHQFDLLWTECLLQANAESRDALHRDLGGTIRLVALEQAQRIVARHDLSREWNAWFVARTPVAGTGCHGI